MSALTRSIEEALEGIPNFRENGGLFEWNQSDVIARDADDASCDHDDWIVDMERGYYVCRCGLCEGGVALVEHGYRERARALKDGVGLFEDDRRVLSATKMGVGDSGSAKGKRYKHKGYFRVRMRFWAMQEPTIPPAEWNVIVDAFLRRFPGAVIPTESRLVSASGAIAGTIVPTKTDIYEILLRCDRDNAENQTSYSTPTRFVKRFYRRWLSIRFRLSGVRSGYDKCPTWLLEHLEELFDKVVTYFVRFKQSKENSTFPSYDYVIGRLLDLYGREDLALDFPISRNKKTRAGLKLFWLNVCKFYSWPYINSADG